MDLEKTYHDTDGTEFNILGMLKVEPEWAANRLQEGEKAIERVKRLEEWLEWIAAHSVVDANVLDNGFPYINMPPNEGADAALRGESISDHADT